MVRDYKTIREMYKVAGKSLADKIRLFCGKDIEASKVFFYYPKRGLDFRSPYELCISGKQESVRNFICNLEEGISA